MRRDVRVKTHTEMLADTKNTQLFNVSSEALNTTLTSAFDLQTFGL